MPDMLAALTDQSEPEPPAYPKRPTYYCTNILMIGLRTTTMQPASLGYGLVHTHSMHIARLCLLRNDLPFCA